MSKKRTIIKICLLFFISFLFLEIDKEQVPAVPYGGQVILAKKNVKKIKVETIHSKKALIKSLENHLIKFDTKISYKINKKIVKNNKTFSKTFWDKTNKRFIPASVLMMVDYYDYQYSVSKDYLFIEITIRYKIPKKQLKMFINKSKKMEKEPILNTEKTIRNGFFSKYHRLEKDFFLKIDHSFLKKFNHNVDTFLTSLEDDPRYNDLKWDLGVSGEVEKFSDFTLLHFTTYTDKSKKELQDIIADIQPILKTKEEVFSEILAKAENLQSKYSINIKNDALGYRINSESPFWDDLYSIPEYNDLSHHNEDGGYYIDEFKGYFKFTKEDRFNIDKTELDTLKNFVKNWVRENIKASMSEEEKVRAINDYMVKEYRYSYGDRGELFGNESGKEKLGKYSVYTCFALVNGKGGVCNAKANMFYRLAKEANLDVIYITGNVKTGLHAWNMVKVDGNWYHLDNTWNRGYYEGESESEYHNRRDYYLKGDEAMKKDHDWDTTKYPAAPMDYQGYVPLASHQIFVSLLKAA